MKMILDEISFEPEMDALCRRARIKPGSPHVAPFERLLAEARGIARPKAAYRLAFIDSRQDNGVTVEGVAFESRVLRINLGEAQRVFAVLATCGRELEAWAAGFEDMLLRYYADQIKEAAVYTAFEYATRHLSEHYKLGRTAFMSPGSIEDWPITQQRPLFRLFDGLAAEIGVQLTDSMLMLPTKSISGLRFPKEESFESCQLCSRPVCPNRRAPYNPNLLKEKYQ